MSTKVVLVQNMKEKKNLKDKTFSYINISGPFLVLISILLGKKIEKPLTCFQMNFDV